ncbi:hypothetical protein GA0115240_15899 [Streptomyces sp. DvalAA-14]|uniref:hypothetical protein n=1 Tax=unclassified Streptomyces TaxID=2593676 RepID=UPI00081B949F|nr:MULTISPECIES: hypothetical protein [unclassified Streptomyces]MYS23980.1 hypothetical protein [Streptomyces sp. SID4948]SCE41200.1 hypothetical protein GA0115240_15899 [Streptomyces sp. DvalAA-14]
MPLVVTGAAVTLAAGPAQAATGSNGTVSITISGTASQWNVSGHWDGASPNDDWFGHILIIGPNGFSRNGVYTKRGEPCETVS